MNAFIYKTTNLINGKIYIGQHTGSGKSYLGSGSNLEKAFKKHGKENFVREIIHENIQNQKALDVLEKHYIKKFNSTNPNIGYNILIGSANGFGNCNPTDSLEVRKKISDYRKSFVGWRHSEETKKKMSISGLGKKMSDETKKKIGLIHIGNSYCKGMIRSEETRNKIRKSRLGRFSGSENPNFGNKKLVGENNPMFGVSFIWITDGLKNKRLGLKSEIPKGWEIGFKRSKNKI